MHFPRLTAGILASVLLATSTVAFTDPQGQEDLAWRDGWTLTSETNWQAYSWSFYREESNETVSGRFDPATQSVYYGLEDTPLADVGFTPNALVEFEDLDGDGRFSLGDPIVQQFRFSDLSINNVQATEAGGNHTFSTRFWSYNGPTVTMTTTVSEAGAPGIHVRFDVDSFRFQSTNSSLGIDLRIHQVFNFANAGLRTSNDTLAYYAWEDEGPAGPIGVTFQPYGAGAGYQTLVVFAQPAQADVSQELEIGLLRRAHTEESDFFDNVSLADWRLWMIGILMMGIVGIVSVARSMSREP